MRDKKTQTKCVGCKFAEWKRTVAGRLHADGSGRCRHPMFTQPIIIPASASLGSNTGRAPQLSGGWIYRHSMYSLNECPTFEQEARDDG